MTDPMHVDCIERLIVDTRSGLLLFLQGMSLTRDEAEDVSQETFERLIRSRVSGNIIVSQAYVYKTARNITLNRFRHKKVRRRAEETLKHQNASRQAVSSERVVEAREDLRKVMDAIGTLPVKCRQVFYMRHVEQLSYREIATHSGVSIGTIEKHLAKGFRRMHSYFRAIEQGDDVTAMIQESIS